MIKILIGLILFLIPFLLVNKFEDKRKGFYLMFFLVLAGQLLIGFFTQLFGVFNYFNIILINLLIGFFVVIKTDWKGLTENLKKIKIDWILVLLLVIVFVSLYSIHHNYSGTLTKAGVPFSEVKNFEYTYPYFSDEWAMVSFIQYSIDSGKLGLVNPLWHNSPFSNFHVFFTSFASEIVLLFGINPLTNYIWLSLFSGLLICLLVYFILRENRVSRFSSFVASAGIIYITQGANLPGIWTFIPLVMGIISLLLSFLFMSMNKIKISLLVSFLILLFYPPLFLFYAAGLVSYILFSRISSKKKIWIFSCILIIGLIVSSIIALRIYFTNGCNFFNVFQQIKSRIFYPTLTKNAIPDFSIWKVIPVSFLIFSIIGFFRLILNKRKNWLIAPILVGLIYWILYSRVLWRFIIENERNVVTTSVLIVLLSGFGIDYIIRLLKKYPIVERYRIILIIQVLILVLFFVLSFSYPRLNGWQDLTLHTLDGAEVSPASPVNAYLHEDDLKLFNFSGKNFLSIPWKGLVIGVATKNYPLNSKDATIGNEIYYYNDFIELDCEGKTRVIEEYPIEYVYSHVKIECPSFELVGISEEGFSLYKKI